MELQILHEISAKSGTQMQFESLNAYLCWFLVHAHALFTPDEQLQHANVHYYSPRLAAGTEYSSGWLAGYPALMDIRNRSKAAALESLTNVLTFIAAARLLAQTTRPEGDTVMSTFRDKFIIDCVRSSEYHTLSRFFSYDAASRILKTAFPDFYEDGAPQALFKKLFRKTAEEAWVLEQAPERFFLIDGQQFDAIIESLFNSPHKQEFARHIQHFMERPAVQNLVRAYQAEWARILESAAVDLDPALGMPFILVSFLHSWLKNNKHTYLIPLSGKPEGEKPPHFLVFLIATESPLRLDKLNVLHIAANLAFGAMRELEKSIYPDRAASRTKSALPSHTAPALHTETPSPASQAWQKHSRLGLVGKSAAMERLRAKIERVARFDTDVLILGESGAGKELVAAAVHHASPRADRPFLVLSLAERSENLIASELFGHEKGAFTGADRVHKGYFERADGGTLFLDEIAQVPLAMQAKLLRVLESRRFSRLGGKHEISTNVRILSATSENLRNQEIREKISFQHQLYYRLEKYIIEVPPLRERKEDIPLLAGFFLHQFPGFEAFSFRDSTMEMLLQYDWPGNVRELANSLHRACINAYDEKEIRPEHFEFDNEKPQEPDFPGLSTQEKVVLQALQQCNFIIEHTVRRLQETLPFHPDRRTLMRYSRELCFLFLKQKNWSLRMAIKSLAGEPDRERAVAKKYRDYFFGDKMGTGIFPQINANPEAQLSLLTEKSIVRKEYAPLVAEFVAKCQQRQILPEAWEQILEAYLSS